MESASPGDLWPLGTLPPRGESVRPARRKETKLPTGHTGKRRAILGIGISLRFGSKFAANGKHVNCQNFKSPRNLS